MPLPVCESHQVWRYFSMPLHIVLKRAELTRDWYGACFRTCMEPAVPLLNKRTPHDKRPIQNVRITNRAAQPCCSCSPFEPVIQRWSSLADPHEQPQCGTKVE